MVLPAHRIGASAGAGWKHEAQVLAKCADHANIVTLYEVLEDAHYVYIVMEECEGAPGAWLLIRPCAPRTPACRKTGGVLGDAQAPERGGKLGRRAARWWCNGFVAEWCCWVAA